MDKATDSAAYDRYLDATEPGADEVSYKVSVLFMQGYVYAVGPMTYGEAKGFKARMDLEVTCDSSFIFKV